MHTCSFIQLFFLFFQQQMQGQHLPGHAGPHPGLPGMPPHPGLAPGLPPASSTSGLMGLAAGGASSLVGIAASHLPPGLKDEKGMRFYLLCLPLLY